MAVSLIYGRDQVTDSRDANFIIYKNAVTFLLVIRLVMNYWIYYIANNILINFYPFIYIYIFYYHIIYLYILY